MFYLSKHLCIFYTYFIRTIIVFRNKTALIVPGPLSLFYTYCILIH